MSSLPEKIKKIQSKMKVPEWPKHISHCKFIWLFQGCSRCSRVANSAVHYLTLPKVETLWLSSLPARIEKIQSKMIALEWPQCYTVDFSDV